MGRPKPSSAINGCHSQGPKTEAGRARSRANAIKHAAYSKVVYVCNGENAEGWKDQLQSYFSTFKPDDGVQESLVIQMAGAEWALDRTLFRARVLIDEASLAIDTPIECQDDLSRGLTVLGSTEFQALRRQQSHLQLSFQRSLNTLIKIKKHFPAEPELELAEIEAPEIEAAEIEPVAAPELSAKPSPDPTPAEANLPDSPDIESPAADRPLPEDDWPKAA